MIHNHVTRDIKQPGKCPGCDEHYIPKGLRLVLDNGTEMPVGATYGGLTKRGEHEWVVVIPDLSAISQAGVLGFKTDTQPQAGHVLSLLSARPQPKGDGPGSGPAIP